jgi:hypothetical protein
MNTTEKNNLNRFKEGDRVKFTWSGVTFEGTIIKNVSNPIIEENHNVTEFIIKDDSGNEFQIFSDSIIIKKNKFTIWTTTEKSFVIELPFHNVQKVEQWFEDMFDKRPISISKH